jgi:hypothetical protein
LSIFILCTPQEKSRCDQAELPEERMRQEVATRAGGRQGWREMDRVERTCTSKLLEKENCAHFLISAVIPVTVTLGCECN